MNQLFVSFLLNSAFPSSQSMISHCSRASVLSAKWDVGMDVRQSQLTGAIVAVTAGQWKGGAVLEVILGPRESPLDPLCSERQAWWILHLLAMVCHTIQSTKAAQRS
jgi:hypothetical protein